MRWRLRWSEWRPAPARRALEGKNVAESSVVTATRSPSRAIPPVPGHDATWARSLSEGGLPPDTHRFAPEIGLEGCRRARNDNSPGLYEGNRVADGIGLREVVGRQQNREASVGRSKRFPEQGALVGVDPCGRFIEQQEPWMVEERPATSRRRRMPPEKDDTLHRCRVRRGRNEPATREFARRVRRPGRTVGPRSAGIQPRPSRDRRCSPGKRLRSGHGVRALAVARKSPASLPRASPSQRPSQ